MKGISKPVSTRAARFSMVRVAYTAGTLQPKPKIMGMKARPLSPRKAIALSMTKAARAR